MLAITSLMSSTTGCSTCLRLKIKSWLVNPAARLAFDTYHLGHEPGIVERIGQIAERVAIVHLGDGKAPPTNEQNRCPLGEGVLPLGEMIRGFLSAGYTGFFDVVLMGEDVEGADYDELVARSKETFTKLAEG